MCHKGRIDRVKELVLVHAIEGHG